MELPESLQNYTFFDPSGLTPEQFEEMQPVYKSYFKSYAASQDLNILRASLLPVVREYGKLLDLGKNFVTMIDKDADTLTPDAVSTLRKLDYIERGGGDPDVIINARIVEGSYFHSVMSESGVVNHSSDVRTDFDYRSVRYSADALHLSYYGNEPWAVFFFTPRNRPSLEARPAADFSRYNQLVLEMKGESGGEVILINLKDIDDPDDGSQTNIEVTLTEFWQTYTIDLSGFDNADLAKLTVLSFLISKEEPLSFAIKTARFVEGLGQE